MSRETKTENTFIIRIKHSYAFWLNVLSKYQEYNNIDFVPIFSILPSTLDERRN